MQKTLQFLVILVFCVGIHAISAKLIGDRSDDCKCKNGKCMRACDVENTKPCLNETKVCVCNPEFGLKDDGECEFCDCGIGFNCTFRRIYYDNSWRQTCICPKGYYNDNFFSDKDRCKVECSNGLPCQNGGTCWKKKCRCPPYTKGDLCEEVFGCSPQCILNPEMMCLYDQENRTFYCDCKNTSLYYDQDANTCKPCPCENGDCVYEIHNTYQKLKCDCKFGYKKYNGYCKSCWCGYAENSCNFNSKGEKLCDCRDGYFHRDGYCLSCNCDPFATTKCEVTGNVKRCFCGYDQEDVLGKCEYIDKCEVNNTCPPPATCDNPVYGFFACECPAGYTTPSGLKFLEPGEVCEDINECTKSTNLCWRWDNVRCVNIPGSYKCECLPGYEPNNNKTSPSSTICIETSKSWFPAVLVVFTTLGLVTASKLVHKSVKKRVAGLN